jgi:site-specific DNA recombinase
MIHIDPPLVARNGRNLKVLVICRVSNPDDGEGTASRHRKPNRKKKQTVQSNADQAATYRQWIEDRTDLKCEFIVIAGQGSGEWLDRDECERIEELVATGTIDVVIAEDLGRIYRRVHAMVFCEFCQDHETRVIAPNDMVDTARTTGRWPAISP